MSTANKAAVAAVRALLDVDGGAFSNLAFKQRASVLDNQRDRAFAASVFYGTLERRLAIDAILGRYLKKGVLKLDPEVRAVLETGVTRQLFLSGANVAAPVSDSVEICRFLKKASASGLVNAVLRKTSKLSKDDLKDLPVNVRYSVCDALFSRLKRQYGQETESVLEGFYNRTSDTIRVNTLKTDPDTLTNLLKGENVSAEKSEIKNALCVNGGFIETPEFRSGLFHVIGIPAQLSALYLDAQEGMRVLDMCAAPGGKTMVIAQQMNNKGEILALDKYANRAELINKNANRMGITCIKAEARDSSAELGDIGMFDRILCDVPCSGFGEIAKKPELRYKDPEDSAALPELQLKLLDNASKHLKAGGRLVYSTCTILNEENDCVVDAFLSSHPDFCETRAETLYDNAAPDGGRIRFVPGKQGSEGFFIAVLERK